jgi:hypothetical protein
MLEDDLMLKIPVIQGIIDRRILVNFRVDPQVLSRELPEWFKPKVVGGFGIGGVCLIRLKHIRPSFVRSSVGFSSENAAHRIAVVWEEGGEVHEGVFIPRRDTSSRMSTLVGGRLFPGEHHHAHFQTEEIDGYYRVQMESDDGVASLLVEGRIGEYFPKTSVFENLEQASKFFEGGSLGYSARQERPGEYEGLELRTMSWAVEPLIVEKVESNYFLDRNRFPLGSVEFDNALLMTGIEHQWHGRDTLYIEQPGYG